MRRRIWWLAAVLVAFVDLAAVYYLLTYRPIRKGMSVAAVCRKLGVPIRGEGDSRGVVIVFREGSEWTGYRQTLVDFCSEGSDGEMRVVNWEPELAPPNWLSRILYPPRRPSAINIVRD